MSDDFEKALEENKPPYKKRGPIHPDWIDDAAMIGAWTSGARWARKWCKENEPHLQALMTLQAENAELKKAGHQLCVRKIAQLTDENARLREALKEAKDRAMDQIARGNKAISEICSECDYQCQGCTRSLDDMEDLVKTIKKALQNEGGE